MNKKISIWLCDLGLKFLNWGEASYGTESHEDWEWLQKTRTEFKEMKAKLQT